jgi:hypothetical protein
MARFFPTIEHTDFQSGAELRLYRLLSTLDDEYTIVHSCPWLRASTKRLYSKELLTHIELYRNDKTNVSGEIDFVICHPEYGLLCVEVKGGEYRLEGAQFVHKLGGYTINPLNQVRNNAFAVIEALDEKKISCPVGYCVYFPDSDIDVTESPLGYRPVGTTALTDGIFILRRHERHLEERIRELFSFWCQALRPGKRDGYNFADQINAFIQAVWPEAIRDNSAGRAIAYDKRLWLRLDKRQLNVVYECLRKQACLVSGFAGTGKTIIATTIAVMKANAGKRSLMLFKNKKIAKHVQNEIAELSLPASIEISTFHALCQTVYMANAKSGWGRIDRDYDEHHAYLQGLKDSRFDCVIVDEAQGLNEADHLALAEYFSDAERYIFADRYQTLVPLENGTSYSSLESIYGISIFNLSTVYRNPYRITEEILKVIDVDHEVINMRGESTDGFEAVFSWDVNKAVTKKIQGLIDAGCTYDDIVVLTQFDEVIAGLPPAITSTIAAFRGMEKPIVFVIPDAATDDTALACALSRCTTKAVVIVDVRIFAGKVSAIRSSYIRSRFSEKRIKLFESDKSRDRPVFIENI